MNFDVNERPNVLPWPPMIYATAVVVALALRYVKPIRLEPPSAVIWLGIGVILAGVAVDFWAMATMRRAQTNLLPHRAADRLVDWGPFALSRNPIYAGNTAAILGVAVCLGDGWLLFATFAAAALTQKLAIRREEAHLSARFGAAWDAYAARTPRWLALGPLRI